MTNTSIYKDIATRTGGDIYIGVVGPVRTGKSTLIKRFMETLVVPNIESKFSRERATDELPQASAGRTIMTTEPKFIPEDAAKITLENSAKLNVRMIDCVGYIVPSALGYIEDEQPRMVMTPWFDEAVPFNMAAEIGTQKVIKEHSTIGLVVTTDGSISEIPREEYAEVEARVISELKEINKPFVVLLNSARPNSPETVNLAQQLSEKYGVSVIPVSCNDISEEDIKDILFKMLSEFPVQEISLQMPLWINTLPAGHPIKKAVFEEIERAADNIEKIADIDSAIPALSDCEYINRAHISSIDLGSGSAVVSADMDNSLFFKILGEISGLEISDEGELLEQIIELSKVKREYDKIKPALDEVNATGYGIVMPQLSELTLAEPEIVRQGGKYGVRLSASAPSIHLMRADINAEVSPIVGSEKQSEELVMYLLKEFEENPKDIWKSNIFGKSLHELINEGLHNKLYRMPTDARMKLQETIERIINEGCGGLICIIL
ncbi:MAG: stage IV sporulation protein A [Oscillospiraceae bacterium]|nr:stage IV sporulation protein A [Oscillospiraceae bacterium]MBQ5816081.1 stage IV sporulation protein A [Oscillospiraceae bacterium]